LDNANRYYSHVIEDRAPDPGTTPTPPAAMPSHRRISSADLFAGERELVIEHHGRLYHLRITQNGKLILTA
jgi:hemin uptake protein HemP